MAEQQQEQQQKLVELNGQKLDAEEFETQRQQLESKPGVEVVQVSENTYKTRIKG